MQETQPIFTEGIYDLLTGVIADSECSIELMDVRDHAKALENYAKRAEIGKTENLCRNIRLCAERRLVDLRNGVFKRDNVEYLLHPLLR